MTTTALITIGIVILKLAALMAEVIEADVIVFAALGILLISGIITPKEALEGFANKGMLTVAILFVVAYAAQSSGFMQFFADRVIGDGKSGEQRSLMRMMFPIAGLSAFLNNTPIAQQLFVDPKPFVIAVAISASASFSTPIGYQTNMMVCGPGGYRIADFLKVGIPLNLIYMLVSILIIPIFWKF